MPRRVGLTKKTMARAQRDERAQQRRGPRRSQPTPTVDAFNNWQINLGLGTNNALSGGTYGFNPITRVRTLIEWMYRGNWLSQIIIDQVAKDMTRGGVTLQCDAEADDIKILNNRLARLKVWPSICDTIKRARLYGGALGYIQIAGADPATPLRPEAVGKGAFRGILALDRWMLEPTLNRLIQDDGPDQGLPEFYRVTTDAPGLRGRMVHHSRCIRLTGIALPYWQAIMENYWGLSIFEPIYDRMIAFDSATMGAAQLAYKAHLRTFKIKDYRQIMSTGGAFATGLFKQMELVRQTQSVEGITVIDSDDEVEVQQTGALTGMAEIMLQLGQQISGGCQIPLTKLFGQSPAGLNSTGEADTRNYYDGIKQEQNHTIKDGVHRVYRVASVSEGIDLGPEFEIEFNPLWQLTDDEMGTIEERDTRSVLAVQESGLVSPRTALMELKARGGTTNRWQTITAENIDEADDELPEIPQPGEVVGPDGEPIANGPGAAAAGIKPGGALRKELGERDAASFSGHQGRAAAQDGIPVTANPYAAGTRDAAMWADGWRTAA
jgi:uncharacterized protein